MTFGAITYQDKGVKLQAWDYYAHELMNSVFVQSDFDIKNFSLGLQYNTFDAVGQMKDVNDPRAKIHYKVLGKLQSARRPRCG